MIRLVVWFYRTWYQITDWWTGQRPEDMQKTIALSDWYFRNRKRNKQGTN